MKRVALDRKDKKIKEFIQSLSGNADGSILELAGKPVVRVLPLAEKRVDKIRLTAAIVKRRQQSRELNRDWEAVDREMWERIPNPGD